MQGTGQVMPRARKDGLVIQKLTDDVLVYDRRTHKAHCLNRTAAIVWEQCDGNSTVAQVAQSLLTQYDAQGPVEGPKSKIQNPKLVEAQERVWYTLQQLDK